jgi:hypothetical protein
VVEGVVESDDVAVGGALQQLDLVLELACGGVPWGG